MNLTYARHLMAAICVLFLFSLFCACRARSGAVSAQEITKDLSATGELATSEPQTEPPVRVHQGATLAQNSMASAYGAVRKLVVSAEENEGMDFDVDSITDTAGKRLVLPVPCRVDISQLVIYAVHTNGERSGPYILNASDDGQTYNKTVAVSRGKYRVEVLQSQLPSLFLSTDDRCGSMTAVNKSPDHSVYAYGSMMLTVTDATAAENGWKTITRSKEKDSQTPGEFSIRGRGNATWTSMKKRPYQLHFESRLNLLGMGAGKTWCLLANELDASLLRNQLFYGLAQEIGLQESGAEQVDVFLNGKYIGVYLLVPKVTIDSTRIDINEETDYLFEIDNHPDDYSFTSSQGVTITMHNKKSSVDLRKLRTAVNNMEKAIANKNSDAYLDMIDIDSFVRYFWVQEISRNYDAMTGSGYFYYVPSEGKFYAGMIWDMDNTLGVYQEGYYTQTAGWHMENQAWYRHLLKHTEFRAAVDDFYLHGGLREILETLPGTLDTYANAIRVSQEMNYLVNPRRHYISVKPATWQGDVKYLRRFLEKRLAFYQKYYAKFEKNG